MNIKNIACYIYPENKIYITNAVFTRTGYSSAVEDKTLQRLA